MIWSLYRVRQSKVPRNWAWLWHNAGEAVKWKKADKKKFQAESSSPIWDFIANMYPDSTGNEKPPFLFNSGMGIKDEKGDVIYEDKDKDSEEDDDIELTEDELLALVYEKIILSTL